LTILKVWFAPTPISGLATTGYYRGDEGARAGGRIDQNPARDFHLCAGKEAFHLRFALHTRQIGDLRSFDIEIGAQVRLGFQPVFVERVDTLDFAVAVGKIAEGAQHFIVVVQIRYAVILSQGCAQIGVQQFVWLIGNTKHIRSQIAQANAEQTPVWRKMRREKDDVHGSFQKC